MPNDDFCGVGNFSVLIPYKELENLVKAATKIDQISRDYRAMEKRYAAMQQMLRETLEKVSEINRYL